MVFSTNDNAELNLFLREASTKTNRAPRGNIRACCWSIGTYIFIYRALCSWLSSVVIMGCRESVCLVCRLSSAKLLCMGKAAVIEGPEARGPLHGPGEGGIDESGRKIEYNSITAGSSEKDKKRPKYDSIIARTVLSWLSKGGRHKYSYYGSIMREVQAQPQNVTWLTTLTQSLASLVLFSREQRETEKERGYLFLGLPTLFTSVLT